ncbi:MAG: exodeoxyribonuclease VII small subunit [Candidatus Hatepunaea meridiana]|nr:exodeoxyribonuclease VII small subunit [Candidatus Hatepunaea meridiana]
MNDENDVKRNTNKQNQSIGKLTFEEIYQRLEAISRELEDGSTPLEKSFVLFEEGQKLVKKCHQMLDNAEKRLKVITEGKEGFEVKEKSIG